MRSAALLRQLSRAAASASRPYPPAANPSRLPALSTAHAVSAPLVEEEAERITFPRPRSFFGLNLALAGRGVIVSDKAFHNLERTELDKFGATTVGNLSGIPLHVRGNVVSGASAISKAQFGKLLKQVTSHISSASNIFVQDGAVGASSKCDVKVRIISDNPSAVLPLSNILWGTSTRAISHDSCPLTVYVASFISSSAAETLGLSSQPSNGFAAADIERSSLVLCGKGFADPNVVKHALAALATPIISARGGLPISARLLVSGDSVILLFAPKDAIESWSELHKQLVSIDAGVILSSHGAAPFFRTDFKAANELEKPASMILAVADSTGVFPSISKLSAGQAAYHFLAGYQDGKFIPAYSTGPSPIEALELATALLSQLKENQISSYLVNIIESGKVITSEDLIKLAESSLTNSVPESKLEARNSKVGDLKGKYKSFLSGKYKELPEEFCF